MIWEKHKNFGKIMLCPENFLYACEKYGILGKMYWYVRKHFGMFAKITVVLRKCFQYVRGKFFGNLPEILGRNIN
jgi:hypothetical protein